MAAAKRYEVTAAQIVVKVPGAQGGEVYMRRGRLLPTSVEKAEVERLLGRGLIGEAKARATVETAPPPPPPPGGDSTPPANPVPAPNAGADKWAEYAKSLGIEVPDGADKAKVRELVEQHKAAAAAEQ